MGDDAVNTAHNLIVTSRGLAGWAVEVGVIAGLVHERAAGAKPEALDAIAASLEGLATNLRTCSAELREVIG